MTRMAAAGGAPRPAIVVLGCAVRLDARGHLADGALARRVEAAARAYAESGDDSTLVVVSGGRRWGRVLGECVEADVMARELALRGVPPAAIVRERMSLSTRDNARFAAGCLARRGLDAAALVTCTFHLRRAMALFVRAGIQVRPVPAADAGDMGGLWPRARERFLTWADLGI